MAKVVNEDVYKAIDAVNKQIQAIVKAGEKGTINVSMILQDYVNVIHSVIPASMDKFILLDTPETPRTYPIQISKSAEAQLTLSTDMLARIKKLPTIGKYREEKRRKVAAELGKDPSKVTNAEIKRYTDDEALVRAAEDSRGKLRYNDDDYSFMVTQGTKSYAELAEVVRRYEGQLEQDKQQLMGVQADYDTEHATQLAANRASATSRRAGAGDMVR